jgi:hypothetical protein
MTVKTTSAPSDVAARKKLVAWLTGNDADELAELADIDKRIAAKEKEVEEYFKQNPPHQLAQLKADRETLLANAERKRNRGRDDLANGVPPSVKERAFTLHVLITNQWYRVGALPDPARAAANDEKVRQSEQRRVARVYADRAAQKAALGDLAKRCKEMAFAENPAAELDAIAAEAKKYGVVEE